MKGNGYVGAQDSHCGVVGGTSFDVQALLLVPRSLSLHRHPSTPMWFMPNASILIPGPIEARRAHIACVFRLRDGELEHEGP